MVLQDHKQSSIKKVAMTERSVLYFVSRQSFCDLNQMEEIGGVYPFDDITGMIDRAWQQGSILKLPMYSTSYLEGLL